MSSPGEFRRLREELELAYGREERKLARRYGRLAPLERLSMYRRFRKSVGRVVRQIGLRPAAPPEPWLPGLKHVDASDGAKPLVLWALGMDRGKLRDACRCFGSLQASFPGFTPVLVTDVADFAFFSRLGWLVEYVPSLSAPAARYAERKRRYLAWRYRDAAVLPAIGLQEGISPEGLPIG